MISRVEFRSWPDRRELALEMFGDALDRMSKQGLYVTVEVRNQYAALRSKLAKRSASKRRKQR